MNNKLKNSFGDIDELHDKCRTCLRNCLDSEYKQLFATVCVSKQKYVVADVLMACTSIKISKDDGFPAQICIDCAKLACKFLLFKIKSEDADSFMHDLSSRSIDKSLLAKNETNGEIDCNNEYQVGLNNVKVEVSLQEHDSEVKNDLNKMKIKLDESSNNTYDSDVMKNEEFNDVYVKKSKTKTRRRHKSKEHKENRNHERIYQCDACEKVFSTVKALEKHSRRHRSKEFNCDKCEKGFYTQQALNSHAQYAHADKKFVCTDCNKAYTMLFHLKRHQPKCKKWKLAKRKTEPREHWACDICNKLFLYRTRYESHMIQEHQDMIDVSDRKLYTCEQCGKSFPTYAMHYAHVHRKHGEKKHLCTDCGKSFTYAVQLKRHRLMHTGEKLYKCNVCGKEYKYDNMFAAHMRSHTGDRPYQCNICEKRFNQSGHLNVHILRHKGIKEHECNLCGKRFTEKGGLTAHSKIHSGETRYSCPMCSKAFYFLKSMRKHMECHQR